MLLLLEDKLAKVADVIEKELNDVSEFGGNTDDDYYPTVEDIAYALDNKHLHADTYHGVSRMGVTIEGCSKVLKVEFDGEYYYDDFYDYDDDDNECYKEEEEFCEFETDYCYSEMSIYEEACQAGVEMFFAEIVPYRDIDYNRTIFMQDYVTPVNDDCSDRTTSADALEKAESEDRAVCDINWIANAIEKYGLEAYRKFVDFIYNQRPEVSGDLHLGNIGYRLDGTPCILDYAGWSH